MIHSSPFLKVGAEIRPEIDAPPFESFLVACKFQLLFLECPMVDGTILTGARRVLETQRVRQNRGRKILALFTLGDGDSGDGREAVWISVQAHMEGDRRLATNALP